MKKYLSTAIMTAFVILAFAAPVVAATNPFIDVPKGHWAYDDLEWLIAEGILSGYPDGTFKGKQPATRYEIASVIARTISALDLDKASQQEMSALKRLFGEFKDELSALGLRLDQLAPEVAVYNDRLNGWRLSGSLIMDVDSWRYHDFNAYLNIKEAKVNFERWFGENEDIYFNGSLSLNGNNQFGIDSFYVEFPAWFGTLMTVGYFSWDWENPYYFHTGGISDLGNLSYITDRDYEAIGFTKSFSLGTFQMFVQKPNIEVVNGAFANVWETAAILKLRLTERFGFDLGLQYMWGDDESIAYEYDVSGDIHKHTFDNLFTYFGGILYDFNDNIGFRGIYYGQQYEGEYQLNSNPIEKWDESPYAYNLAIEIKQELLGFTSLWLEHDFISKNFWTFNGDGQFEIIPVRDLHWARDTRIWRLGAVQRWNDQWRSWLYFAHHTILDAVDNFGGSIGDVTGIQWGVGVEYRYNPYVAFALNYVNSNFEDVDNANYTIPGDNHLIRFRTQVNF